MRKLSRSTGALGTGEAWLERSCSSAISWPSKATTAKRNGSTASIEQRRIVGDRAGLAAAADRVARLLILSEPERAARLTGFAEAQRDAIDASLSPADAAERDQVVAALGSRLGDGFSTLRAEGRRSPLELVLGSPVSAG